MDEASCTKYDLTSRVDREQDGALRAFIPHNDRTFEQIDVYDNLENEPTTTGEDYINMNEEEAATETGDDDYHNQRDYLKRNGVRSMMGNGGTRHSQEYDNQAAETSSQTDSDTKVIYGLAANSEAIAMTDISPDQMNRSREVLLDDDDGPNQSMFFAKSEKTLRIDYVMVYNLGEVNAQKEKLRKQFEDNLADVGVVYEHEQSSDGKLGCVKIHSPWEALAKGAKLMSMRKRIKVNKDMEPAYASISCCKCVAPDQNIVPDEEDFFTAPFDPDKLHYFAIENRDDFFTNAERSVITKMFMDNTEFMEVDDQGTTTNPRMRKGIDSLLSKKVYTAAFPLHEGRVRKRRHDTNFFKGDDKGRLQLYYGWARPSNLFRFQPLDHVRKYFGEKIGLYFAWLGFYTIILIPAALFGVAVFLYGLGSLKDDIPTDDVCYGIPSNFTICPLCDKLCDFTELKGSCTYAQFTYIFDNSATVAMAVFMSAWALVFLEFWKREQAALQFLWDVGDYEADEKYRPGYEKNAKKFKINPITEKPEPYIPWYDKFARLFTSASLIFFLVIVVLASIFAIIVYRLAVAAALFAEELPIMKDNAKLITSVTASVINLLIISVLSVVYKWLAMFTTKLEKHKTYTSHEDSYTFKMIVFQFINYYGSIIYIAYFKGSFVDPPGKDNMYVFGTYRQDQCDPTGCFIELTIQLGIIMIGKQAINSFVELFVPAIKNCIRRVSDNMKNRTRWEDDLDLEEYPQFIMFDEYLEMVIQFGFVTLFVAAFPLAPLFALINNVIEIRLDAYKTVKLFRRPLALKAQDIGAWYPILSGLAYIAVITNAFIIAWTSEFIPKMVYKWNRGGGGAGDLAGYINASLSVTNTLLIPAGQLPDSGLDVDGVNVTECRFRGYYQMVDPPINSTADKLEYEYTRDYWQIFFARMAFVIVFEHTCFLLMALVAIMIPDVSARIKRMRRYERLLVHKREFEDTFTSVRDKRKTLTAMFGIGRIDPT